jgi:hypothetical protein
MAFEVFQKGSAPVTTVPSVTIQKRGLISLNRASHDLIHGAAAVELLWDPDRKVIGIRSADEDNPNAYPVRPLGGKTSKGGSVLVAGTLFTQYIGLDTSEATRWSPKMEDGVLCIDVSVPGHKVKGNRQGAKAPTQSAVPT